jgi:DHA2 family methylenomycin A resistance protein-like MFS transporter
MAIAGASASVSRATHASIAGEAIGADIAPRRPQVRRMQNIPHRPTRLPAIILATSLGFVLVQLDVTIVNVALARIGAGLGMGIAGLQWVVDAYTLAFASLLLSAGALGDRFGARRAFIAGFALFVAASLGCGLAPGPTTLIAARVAQGVGAALLVPSALALLNHACRDDAAARARALGLWTAAGSAAMAAGPVLGGLLIDTFGWRSIFLVNLPLGVVGILLSRRFLEESGSGSGALDPAGQLLGIITLFGLTGAVVEAGDLGWRAPLVLAGLAATVLSGAGLLLAEARGARPMLPLHFFGHAGFSAATLIGFLLNLSFYGMIFVFNLYLQHVRHYSPAASGIAFLPVPPVVILANIAAGRLAARLGPRLPMAVGLAVGAVGFVLLGRIDAGTPYVAMLPGLLLSSGGLGLVVPSMTMAVLSAVPRARSGVASGVLNTVRQAGGAIGVALFGSFFAADGVAGMQVVFAVSAALVGVAAIFAAVALRARPRAQSWLASASAVSLPVTTGTISNSARSAHSATQRWTRVTASLSSSRKQRPRSAVTQLPTKVTPSGIIRPFSRKRR